MSRLSDLSQHFIRPGANLDGDPFIVDPDLQAIDKDSARVNFWIWPLLLVWLLILASFLWGVSGGL